jgi:putative hydrolase of the HAD superfamily
MIKQIIFDFGDVFLNLDKQATSRELQKLGTLHFSPEMEMINKQYEKGLISTDKFVKFYQTQFPNSTASDLKKAWNAILLDFPLYRLEFLEQISKKYVIYLLSNINDLHIKEIIKVLDDSFYQRFIACFKKVYFSHEINMRKPDATIFEYVLKDNNLKAEDTFFVDDTKENTETAKKLGLQVWHINPNNDDVINLESKFI